MRTTDNGDSWKFTTDTAGTAVEPYCLAIGDSGAVYATTKDGKLFRSSDHGWSWQRLTFPFTANINMTVHCARPGGAVFMGSVHGVYRSLDGGLTWIAADTVAGFADGWLLGGQSCTVLTAGRSPGAVRISTDRGVTWTGAGGGLETKVVQALCIDDSGYVIAGASGSAFRSAAPLSTRPAAPLLIAPPDGAWIASTLDTVLSWQLVPGATHYRVEVANDPSFAALYDHSDYIVDTAFHVILHVSARPYWWRVMAVAECGRSEWSAKWMFHGGTLDAGAATKPERCAIVGVYPVPARGQATLALRADAYQRHATLRLVDALGRTSATLLDGALSAGEHSIVLPLRDLPPGMHVCMLSAGGSVSIRAVPVLR
jgi:hypothetical protein